MGRKSKKTTKLSPAEVSVLREALLNEVKEFAHEVGYFSHDEYIGWVEDKILEVEQRAVDLGILFEVQENYQKSKEKGKQAALRDRAKRMSEPTEGEVDAPVKGTVQEANNRDAVKVLSEPGAPIDAASATSRFRLGRRLRTPRRLKYR